MPAGFTNAHPFLIYVPSYLSIVFFSLSRMASVVDGSERRNADTIGPLPTDSRRHACHMLIQGREQASRARPSVSQGSRRRAMEEKK